MGGLVAAGLAFAGSAVAAQDSATIRGVVLEQGTRRPLSRVRVAVLGTQIATLTDREGRYELFVVAAPRELVLRAERPDYAAVLELVRPRAAELTTVNFTLAARAHVLEALGIEARDTSGGELDARRDRSLGDVLDGVSGVQLVRAGGDVGRGYELRIRGARSFMFPATPVVLVDGVRVDVVGVRGGAGILELLDAGSIGRVEVLRGPAAAARYGSEAVNGVIVVTTKR